MEKTIGQIGYDQTTITKVQASGVTPESNAMTDRPAMRSQKTSEASARTCEIMSQMRIGRLLEEWGSRVVSIVQILKFQSGPILPEQEPIFLVHNWP